MPRARACVWPALMSTHADRRRVELHACSTQSLPPHNRHRKGRMLSRIQSIGHGAIVQSREKNGTALAIASRTKACAMAELTA